MGGRLGPRRIADPPPLIRFLRFQSPRNVCNAPYAPYGCQVFERLPTCRSTKTGHGASVTTRVETLPSTSRPPRDRFLVPTTTASGGSEARYSRIFSAG